MRITVIFSFLAAFSAGIFLTSALYASELYEYTDENGAVSFTDDISKIPKTKRKKSKIRSGDGSVQGSSEIPFRLVNNHVLVPVTLKYNGKEVSADFVFDTGASLTVISPAIAERLKINPEDSQFSLMQGVGGITLAGNVLIDFIESGPIRWSNMNVGIIQLGNINGLLGMDFLTGKRFQIDYHGRVIRWQ